MPNRSSYSADTCPEGTVVTCPNRCCLCLPTPYGLCFSPTGDSALLPRGAERSDVSWRKATRGSGLEGSTAVAQGGNAHGHTQQGSGELQYASAGSTSSDSDLQRTLFWRVSTSSTTSGIDWRVYTHVHFYVFFFFFSPPVTRKGFSMRRVFLEGTIQQC